MAPNPAIMQAVEQLGYRVTVGDVATQVGLNVGEANQGLLALASDAGGHLQVAETGDIVYQFPKNFRSILRNKYLQLQWQEWWSKVWGVLFYLIRISFGIFLVLSILLITVAIIAIMIAANSDRDGNNRSSSSSSSINFFWFPDLFWYFSPDYYSDRRYEQRQQRRQQRGEGSGMNFFEAVFSFLFGDGNPNAKLEERRWQEIGTVIRNNQGAVVAEQIAPYLDNLGETYQQEYEDYMLPVLLKFNGQPQVSPEGQLVYYFPELQVRASKKQSYPVSEYLQEFLWRFSNADAGQIMLSAGLGILNFVLALVLGVLLKDGRVAAQIGGLVAFAQSIYWLLLAYGAGFLGIPLIRYFWLQWRNSKIEQRNHQRQSRAKLLANPPTDLQNKISFARQFAGETIIGQKDVIYSTEKDLLEQTDYEEVDWLKRLNRSQE
ncbi:MAG TPA: hypothetical protein VK203_04475 [Nostocaceae cyanobacterium]|nr:hypothetical protein [Nostocaceae cyanobacterium]